MTWVGPPTGVPPRRAGEPATAAAAWMAGRCCGVAREGEWEEEVTAGEVELGCGYMSGLTGGPAAALLVASVTGDRRRSGWVGEARGLTRVVDATLGGPAGRRAAPGDDGCDGMAGGSIGLRSTFGRVRVPRAVFRIGACGLVSSVRRPPDEPRVPILT